MDEVTNQILFIKWVLRRDMSSAPAGGALRASPSLVELSGRLPVWWSSRGVSQSGGGLTAPPSLVELSGRLAALSPTRCESYS